MKFATDGYRRKDAELILFSLHRLSTVYSGGQDQS